MNYSTKVLPPVVRELITNYSMENMCVSWGCHYDGIELTKTCPVDNFITLLSLHARRIFTAFTLASFFPPPTLKCYL